MLKHHADSQTSSLRRGRDGFILTVPQNGPGIRLSDAVDDLHQSALAGTILAKYRMDLAGLYAQRNIVVGDNAGVPFCNASKHKPRLGIACNFNSVHVSNIFQSASSAQSSTAWRGRSIAGSEQAIRGPRRSTSDRHVDIHPNSLEIRSGSADFTPL